MESETTVFESLATSLPVEERKSLLSKINGSLQLYESSDDYRKKEISSSELELKVQRDIKLSSWFDRFIIKIYSFFTGKSVVEVFLKRELNHLRRRLTSGNNNPYFDPEVKRLTGRLASEIYSLYVLAAPLNNFFKMIWHDSDFIENVYSTLITEIIHTKKDGIYDFISLEEMEAIFEATGEKNQIRKKIIKRINEYLNSIPEKIIQEIQNDILPFYLGKFFVLFPFKNLLNAFGCSLSDLVEFRSPTFQHIDYTNVIDRIEHFYFALNLFTMIDWNDEFNGKIAGLYLNAYEKVDPDFFDEKLSILKNEIRTLNIGVQEFLKKTPLDDILKLIKGDIYYELNCKIPKPNFFEFYGSTLKLRLLSSFTDIFQDVRKQFINTSIDRIFVGYKLFNLNGYREYNDFNYKEMDLNYFKYISSLMLVHNFFVQYYKNILLDVFQLLYKNILLKSPSLQSRFFQLMKDIEKTTEEILKFDKSLMSDQEDGKTFASLKSEIKKSPSLFRKYKSFIIEKDLEAERLIISGIDILGKIRKAFESLTSSPVDLIRLQLSSVYPLVDREKPLRLVIKNLLVDVTTLSSLLKQNLDVEKS